MATVIDSLVLELGIDPKKFTQGQRDAMAALRNFTEDARAQGQRVEEQTRRMEHVLGNFKREAISTLAVFLGGKGIKEFIGYITSLDASTARLGKTLNMSAEDVSQWQGAFKQIGGSAESANGAMAGLGGEMQRFLLTGQSSMLPVLSRLGVSLFDDNRELKTAGQLWLELADAVKDMKDTEKASFIGMIPGANQDMINLIIKGRPAMEAYLRAAREAGTTTKESAAEAERYQAALSRLDQSATNLGRSLVTNLTPALVAAMDAMKRFIQGPTKEAKEKFQSDYAPIAEKHGFDPKADSFWEQLGSRVMGIPTKSGKQYKWGDPYASQGKSAAPASSFDEAGFITPAPGARPAPAREPGSLPTVQSPTLAPGAPPGTPAVPAPGSAPGQATVSEREAYIRTAAAARQIDPNVAVQVARSEGLGARAYVGDRGSSFGDFQLHYGGMASGGMAVKGLGDDFTKKTGLDAKDPATWKEQTDFALDRARQQGWGAWHGWKGLPFAGISPGAVGAPAAAVAASGGQPSARDAGGGGNTTTVTTTIGQVQVNAPQARSADDIAQHIGPALDRVITAGAANVGQE